MRYFPILASLILAIACSNSPVQHTDKNTPPPIDSVAKADSILKLKYDKTNWSTTIRTELARWDSCKARQIDSAIMVVLKLPANYPKTREAIFALDTMPYGHIYSYGRKVGNEYQRFLNTPPPVKVIDEPYYPMTEKPVIYLYPEKEQKVSVKLGFNGTGLYTWPLIDNDMSWTVTAKPNGMLVDKNGEEYPYLFWEGQQPDMSYINQSEGFVVEGKNTEEFLTQKLKTLGLNARERADFITYWAPRMKDNKFNFIRFETTAYNSAVPLTISPMPESMQRVLMAFKKVDENYHYTPQELKPFERKGYTVIEWGGIELPTVTLNEF